jgi:hypothetical protein
MRPTKRIVKVLTITTRSIRMMAKEVDHMFNFQYEKTSDEIKKAAETKISTLEKKIADRAGRIASLRKEHEIDDGALIQLLTEARRNTQRHSYSYSTSNAATGKGGIEERTIGAGVVNHLLTENDFLEADRDAVKRLKVIVRNIRPLKRVDSDGSYELDAYKFSYEELEFLGF